MNYRADFHEKLGWRVVADYRTVGGELMHVCLATNEMVARETAVCMNDLRR